jgi:hypothetical protein
VSDLPDGSVEHCSVTVTSYFDDDGEMQYVVETTGSAPCSTYVGLLEMGKHDLLVHRDNGEL